MKLLYILLEEIRNRSEKIRIVNDEMEEVKRASKELGISDYAIMFALMTGKHVSLPEDIWSKLENTDSYDIQSMEDFISFSKQYGKDYKSIMNVKNPEQLPPALILQYSPGKYHLVGGNTRLMYYRALELTPKVIIDTINKNK